MTENLKKHIVSGLKWNSLGQFGRQGLALVISITLARLLEPEDFGLISIILIFTNLANVFIDSGFGSAIIQKKEVSEIEYSTVYFFNILASIFLYLLIYLSAPLIAKFYNLPELEFITRLLSLVLVINSIGMVHSVYLTKNLYFKRKNLILLSGVLSSGIIAILFAFLGFGVYSLVYQTLTFSVVTTFFYLFYSNWKPKVVFKLNALGGLFNFGSKMLLSSILGTIFLYIDNLWIGKIFDVKLLGFYQRGKSTKDIINSNASGILSSLCFPIFSKLNDQNEELFEVSRKMIRLASFIVTPIFTGLFLLAGPFVHIVYSAKWMQSVPFVKLFCLIGVFYPISVIAVQIIMAKGYAGLMLKLEILKKALMVIAMVIGIKFGIMLFLYAMVFEGFISQFLNLFYVSKILDRRVFVYYRDLYPSILISFVMGFILWVILNYVTFKNDLFILLLFPVLGAGIYLGLSLLFKLPELNTLKNHLLKKI